MIGAKKQRHLHLSVPTAGAQPVMAVHRIAQDPDELQGHDLGGPVEPHVRHPLVEPPPGPLGDAHQRTFGSVGEAHASAASRWYWLNAKVVPHDTGGLRITGLICWPIGCSVLAALYLSVGTAGGGPAHR